MSYLGKISAIVSANTGDFVSKLAASGKEVDAWARSLQSNINKASTGAASSLRNIYTEAQKLERSLQAAKGGLKFKGIDAANIDAAVSRMQALFSATKEVNEPLARAARTLEKLPAGLQGGFLGAMKRAQSQAERLSFEINKIGEGKLISGSALEQKFAAIAKRVQMTADAVDRLDEAAKSFGALATGKELRFRMPEYAAEMARAQSSQEAAAATPGGNFSGTIQRQQAAALAVAEAFGRMEAAQLEIGGDVAGTTARFQQKLAVLRLINTELERKTAATASGGVIFGNRTSTGPNPQAELARTRQMWQEFQSLSPEIQASLESERAALNNIAVAAEAGSAGVGTLVDANDRMAASMKRAGDAADQEAARLARQQAIERDERALGSMLGRTTDVMFGRARERGTAAEKLLGVTPRGPTEIPRELDAVGSRINSLRSQIDSLPAGLGRQMIPDLQRIQTEFVTVAMRGKATTAEIRNMEMALRRAEMQASRLSAVSNFAKGFGGFGTMGLNLGIDQKWMNGLGAQIELLQGKLTGLSATARGPAVAAMERLRMIVASGMARGVVGTQGFNEQLKVATQTVVRLTAAAANMRPGRLADQLKRVGDVARGSFSNMGLVVQQGLFAIDDAFSVTGGWDQRIRASANNVSQALFLLGGNYGLIAGVILSATAQGIVGLLKWTGATEKAEDRQRRLKLQLESTNHALERQREIAKTLADAYRDMARSIRESGLSDRGREELRRNQPMEDLKRKQADQRLATIEATDPTVGRMNAIIANVDRKLETEENAAERRRLLRRRREAEEQRRLAIETIEGSGATNARAVLGTAGFDEALRQQEEARAAIERRLAAAQNGGPSRAKEAQELSRALAVINNTIQRIQAAASNNGFSAAQRAADRNARAQQNLSGTAGYTFAEYVARKSQEFIESLQEQFNAGQIDFQEFQRLMSQQEEMAKKAEQVSVALASFAKALDDAAASLASALDQEVTQAADRARRQANAAEAEFGANDPRTRAARSDQRELEAERRRIAEERARIEEESSAMRIKFTQDAIAGRGDPRATAIAQRMQEIDEALSPANIGNLNTTEQESLRLERNRLEAEMSQIFASSPEAMSLAGRADQLDIREQRNNQRRESANRGMELAMSPAERAAREARQGFADIVANYDRQFEELADRNNGRSFAGQDAEAANLRDNRQAAIRRFANDQMRSAAPAIFEMADAVANAVLQGPSRQALEVSDVSTMEGSKELNRLLRGDDASKNANIVELQKQNQNLEKILAELQAQAKANGVVLDLRG